MKYRLQNHSIAGAFVFLLLGIFAVLSTALVLFGAQGYRNALMRADAHNRMRIQHAVMMSAVRSEDGVSGISVREIDGRSVVCIQSEIDGENYTKYLYCHEGELCELFSETASGFNPDRGQMLCRAQSLRASVEDDVLHVVLTNEDGTSVEAVAALRCARK